MKRMIEELSALFINVQPAANNLHTRLAAVKVNGSVQWHRFNFTTTIADKRRSLF